ncbi:spectrin beta chain, non-erythrocytic 2-like isoform X3 [Phasianus colchicus]|uniref:spectrin beta chain, non-erythrocytic 2-like isoform X3 n=1 Tax=Phasianus colchicus TaxID=9054 RepID=UPI00129DBB5C|nr:spectrin beta chain, non-erythrocytic 2-like isoform X3 [Phasianus colchicus]
MGAGGNGCLVGSRLRQRQAEVWRRYAALQELWEQRRGRLQEQQRLWQLRRELDDVEQWVMEREVVAAAHEMGQDYEHVTVRRCPTALPHSAAP